MFEGAEGSVALAGVVGFARAAHVKNHSRKREILGDIDGALQFVHGFDAADALDFADGKGLAALAGGAEVAAGGGVDRGEGQAEIGQDHSHRLGFGFSGVIEMGAGAENFDAGKAGSGDLAEEFAGELAGNEKVGG